jgi:hypothetical protein
MLYPIRYIISYPTLSHYIHLVLWTKIKLARGQWLYSLTVASEDGFSIVDFPVAKLFKKKHPFLIPNLINKWRIQHIGSQQFSSVFILIWSTKEHMYFKNLQTTFSKYKSSQCTSGFSNFTSKANPSRVRPGRDLSVHSTSHVCVVALGTVLRLRRTGKNWCRW